VSISYSTFFLERQENYIPTLWDYEIDENISSNALYYTRISEYDSLYSSVKHSQDTSWDVTNLQQWQGAKYLSSFRGVGRKHSFVWTGYVIVQKWIWEVFIDTISKKWKVFVYTKNSPVEITLTNDAGDLEYTTIYLQPGMYIEFRTGIWKNLNNADRLRIATVNNLWYLGSLEAWNINSQISEYFTLDDGFFMQASEQIKKTDTMRATFFSEISDARVFEISGYWSIQRYLHLFVNDEKKKVFYKNILIQSYLWLLQAPKVDTSLLIQIRQYESKLREIDEASYFELLQVREDIMLALYSTKNYSYIPAKILFAELSNSDITVSEWMYSLYSYSLFSSENKWDDVSQQLTKSYFEAFSAYIENDENMKMRYDYFLYFLEKRLVFILSWDIHDWNVGTLIEFLSSYVKLSLQASYTEKNQKITQIYSITMILEAIDIFMREQYFLDERSQDKILLLRTNISFDSDKISDLNKNVTLLYDLYQRNKNTLTPSSTRDNEIIRNIQLAKENIDEYVVAITNYSEYRDVYSESSNSILWVDTIQNNQFEISQDSAKKYLNQFVWISQQSYTISVMNNSYYKIENVIIWGKRFNFEIYPLSSSRLKNIFIDGIKQTTQYNLDAIEWEWEEKYKTAVEEKKSDYDFSKFFLITFFNEQEREIENFDIQYSAQESKAEIVFKRDILLWENGEFSWLWDFLKIDYSDISLVQVNNMYNIFLNDIDFIVDDTEIEGRRNIQWKIYSEYILNSSEHTFKELSLKIESERKWANNTLIYELGGTKISLIWNIDIKLLESRLRETVQKFDVYKDIYNSISPTAEKLIIEYTPTTQKTRFRFDSFGKSFTIILQNLEITGVYEWTLKLNSNSVMPQDINNYLK